MSIETELAQLGRIRDVLHGADQCWSYDTSLDVRRILDGKARAERDAVMLHAALAEALKRLTRCRGRAEAGEVIEEVEITDLLGVLGATGRSGENTL